MAYQTYARNVSLQPGQRLAFAAGKGYYAGGAATQRPMPDGKLQASDAGFVNGAAPDPYAGIIAGLPRPMTDQQITSQANSEISPLVAAITGQIKSQVANATNAIKGYSADAAAKLAALDFGAPYTAGEQSQAAVDAALRDSLANAGSQGADALASRLAVINDPTVKTAADSLSANGAANGNTALASGSAALGNLIANAAAAKDYGMKLPGIQQLAGLQDIASAQQQGTANIGTQTQQLESQLPSIVQSLSSENQSRASALASAKENQVARQDAINATAANNATKLAQTKATAAAGVTKANIAAAEKASAAQISQARSDRSYRLQFAKTFGYDPVTGRTLPGYSINAHGAVVKTAAAKAAKQPQLTAFERQKFSGLASTIASNGHDGFTDAKGVAHPAITWQQALVEMDKEGIPQPLAMQAISKYYPVNVGTPATSFGSLASTAGKK